MTAFADIIAPITEDEFFRDYFGTRFLHIPAATPKFPGLMPWTQLNDLLSQSALWTRDTFLMTLNKEQVHPNQYCRVREMRGDKAVVPDTARVMDLVKRGATLNLLYIDTFTPVLRDIANTLRETLGMYTQANLYCSWAGVQAFQAHCDPHDAWVFHTEGEKRWRIYKGRAENPIRHDAFDRITAQPTPEERGELVADFVMKPGDVLYIPRGIYHEALAVTPGTVHVTFGCFGTVGLDLLNVLWPLLVKDKDFRAFLPRLTDPKGEQAWGKRLKELGQKLATTVATQDVQDALKAFAKDRAKSTRDFDLPQR
jgi:ribosomal protein L16 Arg81 hydroxylase